MPSDDRAGARDSDALARGDAGPDLRVLQANERTLLAWLRTGIALITFGFAIGQISGWLNRPVRPDRISGAVTVGNVIVFLGVAAEILALVRYRRIRQAILAGRPAPVGAWGVYVVVLTVAALGALLGVRVLLE